MRENIKIYIAVFVALSVAGIFYELNLPDNANVESNRNMAAVNLQKIPEAETYVSISEIEAYSRTIRINSISSTKPGFIIIRKFTENRGLPIVGVSSYISNKNDSHVLIVLNEEAKSGELFVANFYVDNGDQSFLPSQDSPLLDWNDELFAVPFRFQ